MCSASMAPTEPPPVITCSTPGGNPASSKSGATAKDPNGPFSDGLAINTFPVAKQGAALINREATGELYGFMAAQTLKMRLVLLEAQPVSTYPSGSWRTNFTKPSSAGK